MPINWTTSAGQPVDSVGADGDMDFDYVNRFQWGPKGRITAGSWVGTANNVSPLYSYLGPNTFGQSAPATFSGTLSSTPQLMVVPGTTTPYAITVTQPTPYYGTLVTSGVANTLELYNQTTASSVQTQSSSASTTVYGTGQPFQPTLYVLLPGNTYVYRLTGSGTGQIGAWPSVSVSPMALNQAISSLGPIQFSTNTNFTTTGMVPFIGTSNTGFYWRPLRAGGYIYNVVATFTPSGSSTASNSLNIFMNQQNSGGTVSTYAGFGKVFGTGKPYNFGPFPSTQTPITNANQYWFNINTDSACSGTLTLDCQVVL